MSLKLTIRLFDLHKIKFYNNEIKWVLTTYVYKYIPIYKYCTWTFQFNNLAAVQHYTGIYYLYFTID